MSKPFHFKQFTIHQDRCAMKIGTDGVLLGAWTPLANAPESILDIGAGTGIIALMLAQRSTAETIDAIEIAEAAYEQCMDNFEQSPWADRLFCYHAGLDEFVEEIEDRYELIVSNPPFYSEAMASGSTARDLARQNQSLPFGELLEGVSKLLSPEGVFTTIIPNKEEAAFKEIAATYGLLPKHITHVKGTATATIKRSMLAFTFSAEDTQEDTLVIEHARHEYTAAYTALTQEFYLKM